MKKIQSFSFPNLSGDILHHSGHFFEIHGHYQGTLPVTIDFWAACPYDIISSQSATGFPFPNEQIAYDRTPNVYTIELTNDPNFVFEFFYPNSYYLQQGRIYIPPHLNYKPRNSNVHHQIFLKYDVPGKSLTSRLF